MTVPSLCSSNFFPVTRLGSVRASVARIRIVRIQNDFVVWIGAHKYDREQVVFSGSPEKWTSFYAILRFAVDQNIQSLRVCPRWILRFLREETRQKKSTICILYNTYHLKCVSVSYFTCKIARRIGCEEAANKKRWAFWSKFIKKVSYAMKEYFVKANDSRPLDR